jgi:hypothetical protein
VYTGHMSETKRTGLKITQAHYDKLEAACHAVVAAHSDGATRYQAAGLSSMRLNWDILRAATIDGEPGTRWVCIELYPYLNDTHINSALARIMGNDGKSSKQAAQPSDRAN